MTAVRVVTSPGSARLYVCGLRVHHGLVGAVLAAAGVLALRPRWVLAGGVLMAHDATDRPWPLIDP